MITNIIKNDKIDIAEISINFGRWGDSIAEEKKQLKDALESGFVPFSIIKNDPIETWFLKRKKGKR